MAFNNNFPPSIDPQLYSLLAVVIGAAVVDDFSAAEQSSIGNWLMLVSQYIITHAAQQNLIENRKSNYQNFNSNQNIQEEIDYLTIAIKRIYEELENLKK